MATIPPQLRTTWIPSALTLHGADSLEGTKGVSKFIFQSRSVGTMWFSHPGEARTSWRGVCYTASGVGLGAGVGLPVAVNVGKADFPFGGSDTFGTVYFERKTPPILDQLADCTGVLWCPGGNMTPVGYSYFGVTFLDPSGREIAKAWQKGTGVTIGSLGGVSLTRSSFKVTRIVRGNTSDNIWS